MDLAISNNRTLMLEHKNMAVNMSFNATNSTRTYQVHPTNLSNTVNISSSLMSHRRARSSNTSMRTGIYLHGVQRTCQAFPGSSPSTLSNCFQILSQSSRQRDTSLVQNEPQSKQKSTNYSQHVSLEQSRNHNRWPTPYS